MASKLSKKTIKGQRSVLQLIKDKEVTELNSDDNNSDLLSEEESITTSAARADRATTRRKRK